MLPNPGMDFVPFDILTAEELDKLVENIESLADGSGLDDGAITPEKRSGGFYHVTHVFDTGTGTKSITGVPFKPKQIIVTYGLATSTNGAVMSQGMATDGDSIVQSSVSIASGPSGPSFATITSATTAFVRPSPVGGGLFIAPVTSFNNDGITVNVTTNDSTAGNRTFNVLFMG